MVLAGTLIVDSAKANPFMIAGENDVYAPRINFDHPISGKCFNSTTIPIKIQVYMDVKSQAKGAWFVSGYRLLSVKYLLDGQLQGKIAGDDLPNPFLFNLTGLRDGKHSLEVIATAHLAATKTGSSGKIYFTVDTTAPKIQFVPSQQQTFDSASDASFNFTCIDIQAFSWLGYSLDGKDVITLTDNVTSTVTDSSHFFQKINYPLVLEGLADGSHTLTVFAEDLAGNVGESEAFEFNVGQEAQPEIQVASEQPFPTTIAVLLVTVATVGSGAFIYLRKNNRRK
jgi:hypothetical protein